MAIALRDVAAIENPESILKRGDYDTAITTYRVDKKTGETSFCSHGGYCYPTHIIENGTRVEALRLTNCKIGRRAYEGIPDEVNYGVEVIRSKVSPTDLKIDDLDNRLLDMGLSSACAGNTAQLYVKQPGSSCANLTRRALEGNLTALEKLKECPDYCNHPAASFDCSKASAADELAICNSDELAQLDTVAAAGFDFVRLRFGKTRALAIGRPLLKLRQACGGDRRCIQQNQLAAIRAYQKLGAPLWIPETLSR